MFICGAYHPDLKPEKMIDTTCALLFGIPILLLLAVIAYVPVFVSKQNQKILDYLKEYMELTRDKFDSDRKQEKEKTILTVSLQAYERMMLFLERINPPNLLTRVMTPGLKAGRLQSLLLNSIREEYEHNMSQQLYVSNQTWELIKSAKEEVVSLINRTAAKVKQDEDGSAFAHTMLTNGFTTRKDPIEKAMRSLKNDLKDTF